MISIIKLCVVGVVIMTCTTMRTEREHVAAFRAECPGFVVENFEIKANGDQVTTLRCTEMAK